MTNLNIEKEMRVLDVREEPEAITVTTTGAKYVVEKTGERGRILCHQTINQERLLATVELPYPLSDVSVEKRDDSTCVLQQLFGRGCYWLKLQINRDSLLEITTSQRDASLSLAFAGHFVPEFSEQKDGNCFFADEIGGIGIYPQRGFNGKMSGARMGTGEWRLAYRLHATHPRMFVSVFPPRRFDEAHYLDDRGSGIAMYGFSSALMGKHEFINMPYPTDDELEQASTYASIFVLFLQFNRGRLTGTRGEPPSLRETGPDASYSAADFTPLDEREQARVIEKAHSLNMKVLPYLAPFHSLAQGRDFLRQTRELLEKYDFDGIYFDGLSPDVLAAYDMVRDLRGILAGKILFLHTSKDPFDSDTVTCPFIHAYADYVLRAEFNSAPDDKFLRYAISGYNTSNTINYACTGIFPSDTIRPLMAKAMDCKTRFVYGMPEGEVERIVREEYGPMRKASENRVSPLI